MALVRDFGSGKWPFGGKGGPDDVPSPAGAGCMKINEMLASADEQAGEYSFGGVADTLPGLPGLLVDGVGMIRFPLGEEQAQQLIAQCEKSPFGHNMDTKMDENVRKSWQLQPDQFEIKNPAWQTALAELTERIARRLGYKGVPLQSVLYKLLIYGEGGHFLKHQDTEKEDGMIATLVVQPPSDHEGGDLIVYRNGEVQYRHDFGKAGGTAAYLPHYAVHYADAEHSLEKVTKGFRLALVCSICLPASMRHLKRDPNKAIGDELADLITCLGPEDESFALLLSHEYTKKSIGELGSGALKGVDSARFRALGDANAAVSDDKKLRFYIGKLSYKVNKRLDEDGWSNWGTEQAIHWYTTTGEDLGHWKDMMAKKKLNFLNPAHETLSQLWKSYGNAEDVYTGNEGPIKSTKYSRFVIVAWPASRHLENVLKLMSADLAVEILLSRRPVDAVALRAFVDAAGTIYRWAENAWGSGKPSVRFTRSFCELLLDANDPELAELFFAKYCGGLGSLDANATLIPVITKIIRTFDWNTIGEPLLGALSTRGGYESNDYSGIEMLLRVASGLDDGVARQALLKESLEKVKTEFVLRNAEAVEVFWENVVRPADQQMFDLVTEKLQKKTPSELGPFVDVFSRDVVNQDEHRSAVLAAIAAKRMAWLKDEIERLGKVDKTFSWKMPYAAEDNLEIEKFFQGPDESMTTEGMARFRDLWSLKNLVSNYKYEAPPEASFTMEVVKGEEPFVRITKTREWFDDSQANLSRYAAELARLTEKYGAASGSPHKKARHD